MSPVVVFIVSKPWCIELSDRSLQKPLNYMDKAEKFQTLRREGTISGCSHLGIIQWQLVFWTFEDALTEKHIKCELNFVGTM